MSEAKKIDPEDIDNYFNENRCIRDTAAHFNISINKVWNIIERFDDGDDGLQLASDYMEVYKELFSNEDDDIYMYFYHSMMAFERYPRSNLPASIEDTADNFDVSIDKVWEIIKTHDNGENGLKYASDYLEIKEKLSNTKAVENQEK
jgi:hypothetical protein